MNGLDPVALGLPHREPFIFVDEVLQITPGESAIATKSFPEGTPFFQGHFPGDPLVPGVIITEALAQTAGIAAGQPGKAFRLSAIRGMKFLLPVRPGETLLLHANKTGVAGSLWQFEVRALVRDALVAQGTLVLSEA